MPPPSVRNSYATAKRGFNGKGKPKECRSPSTFHGYPVNPVTGSLQKQIVNALHLGNRDMASTLLSRIGDKMPILKPNHFVPILGYCAMKPDPLFVMDILKYMQEKGIDLNNKCHTFMIEALCKGGYILEAFNLMNNCEETSYLYPTLRKYNTILRASAEMKNVSYASRCLDLMENEISGKNEITYIELLKLAVLQKNLSLAHSIWKEYAKYYSFNLISLRKFIHSFRKLGDLETAHDALRHLVTLVFNGGFIITKNDGDKMVNARLDVPIPFYSNLEWNTYNTDHNIVNVFDEKKVKSVKTTRDNLDSVPVKKILRLSFTDVIYACFRAKNDELAEYLFYQMQKLGVKPSRSTYDGLIRVLVRERGFEDGIKVLKVMQQKNLKPLDSTFAAISVGCSKELELDLAESFLDQMANCTYVYSYNMLLAACDTHDQPERGVRVFGKIKRLKVGPDIRTYELLFSLFGNVNAPYENGNRLSQAEASKRIHLIEDDMVRNDIQHSYISIRNLLKALGSEGMISDLLHYLRIAEKQFTLKTPVYNIVLQSLIDAKEGNMAVNVFKTMVSHGYRPNDVTYNIMIDCCSVTGSYKSAQGLIAMMIRNGYPPYTPSYTALIKLVLELGDFDEALILLNKACSEVYSEGIRLDALLFNTILKEACWKDRIDILEYVMDRMHKERVKPDSTTCGFVFSAYVNRGFYNTALEALQVMSVHMLSQQDIDENKTFFEDEFIYAEDSEAESKALDLFKDPNENLAVALLNLRWCAMVGNTISWSTGQSRWVKRLADSNSVVTTDIDEMVR